MILTASIEWIRYKITYTRLNKTLYLVWFNVWRVEQVCVTLISVTVNDRSLMSSDRESTSSTLHPIIVSWNQLLLVKKEHSNINNWYHIYLWLHKAQLKSQCNFCKQIESVPAILFCLADLKTNTIQGK